MRDKLDDIASGGTRKNLGHRVLDIVSTVAFVLLVYAALQYFFPPPPKPPAGEVRCTFELSANASPARRKPSSTPVSKIEVTAKLSNRFEDQNGVLWQMDASAALGNQTVPMMGSLFLDRNGTIDGISMFQESSIPAYQALNIATLNTSGILDANKSVAYVWFQNEASKLNHPFRYQCRGTVSR